MSSRTGATGETGELLVLAELYRRDVLGGQAARGARGIDLLTSTGPTIQVKAKRPRGRWMLGQEGRRPAADVVVLVAVGTQHSEDEFFVLPVNDLYEWAETRHRLYWEKRPGETTGERDVLNFRQEDAAVQAFLEPYREAWSFLVSARPGADDSR
jgi:hypothetical protein